jgi:hypothetical protein
MNFDTAIQIPLSADERAALDNYRRQQANPPSRRAAARQLIRSALQIGVASEDQKDSA